MHNVILSDSQTQTLLCWIPFVELLQLKHLDRMIWVLTMWCKLKCTCHTLVIQCSGCFCSQKKCVNQYAICVHTYKHHVLTIPTLRTSVINSIRFWCTAHVLLSTVDATHVSWALLKTPQIHLNILRFLPACACNSINIYNRHQPNNPIGQATCLHNCTQAGDHLHAMCSALLHDHHLMLFLSSVDQMVKLYCDQLCRFVTA